MNGQAHLCEQHREQTHVVSAVCPVCVGIERQNLIAAYLELENKLAKANQKLSLLDEIKSRIDNYGPEDIELLLKSWQGWLEDIHANTDLTEKYLHVGRLLVCMATLTSKEEWANSFTIKEEKNHE